MYFTDEWIRRFEQAKNIFLTPQKKSQNIDDFTYGAIALVSVHLEIIDEYPPLIADLDEVLGSQKNQVIDWVKKNSDDKTLLYNWLVTQASQDNDMRRILRIIYFFLYAHQREMIFQSRQTSFGDIHAENVYIGENIYHNSSPQLHTDQAKLATISGRNKHVFVAHYLDQNDIIIETINSCLTDANLNITYCEMGHMFDWHREFVTRLSPCNAGILLLDENALSSEQLYDEARMIRWLNWLENRSFKLLVICLKDEIVKQLREDKKWSRLNFRDDEILRIDHPSKVKEQLQPRLMHFVLHETPIQKIQRTLASILTSIDTTILENVYYHMTGDEPIEINAAADIVPKLAQEMLFRGLRCLHTFFEHAEYQLKTNHPEDINYIIELLAINWIDFRSAALIAGLVHLPSPYRVLCLNTERVDTVTQYIKRARSKLSSKREVWSSWRAVTVLKVASDHDIEHIIHEIRLQLVESIPSLKSIRQRLEILARIPPNDKAALLKELQQIDQMINEKLAYFEENNEPCLAIFAPEFAENRQLLKSIRLNFPSLCFIVMTGDKTKHPEDFSFAEPLLEKQRESDAEDEYLALFDKFSTVV